MTPHELNKVFNKYRLNAVRHTVNISWILRSREITNEQELAKEVEARIKNNLLCRVIIFDYSVKIKSLFDLSHILQMLCQFEGFIASATECYEYIYKVFVTDSWLGFVRERKCVELLKPSYPTARLSGADEDLKYAVDIIIPEEFGVQLKPESYKAFNMQSDLNKSKNAKYGLPVYYVWYDRNGEFDFSELPNIEER